MREVEEVDHYAVLLENWRQLAAVYQSRADEATAAEARDRAQAQADRFVRLLTSMECLIADGRFSLDGPRMLHEVPRPEAGLHKECPACHLVKHERHFGRKVNTSDGLKTICRECERQRRRVLKNEGSGAG